jgi:hypothetical protein
MQQEPKVTLFPTWRQAAKDAAEQFTYGDMITMDWLHEHFELKPPERGTARQFQAYQFDFLEAIDGFKNTLLGEHKMALQNVRGQGYRIVQPREQTDYGMNQLRTAMQREIRKAAEILHHVDRNLLTDEEWAHNINTRSKIAALASFTQKKVGAHKPLLLKGRKKEDEKV